MFEKTNKKRRIKIAITTKFMLHIVKTLKESTIIISLFVSTLENAAI